MYCFVFLKMGKLKHKIIADGLLIIHILWAGLLVGGTIFLIFNRWYIPYHLTIITGTLLLNLAIGGCPLTWWEEEYRKAWDPETESYNNSFIAAHLKRFIGVSLTPKQVNWALFGLKVASYFIALYILIND